MEYKPHDYQQFAINYILEHPIAAVILGMGLGKTSITLTAIEQLIYDSFEVSKVLVVAPLRVARNTWSDEIHKWNHLKHLRYSIVLGSAAERKKALEADADIYIINRENLQWLIEQSGVNFFWDMVVLDELSSFKNWNCKRFKAFMKVRPNVKRVIGLTGTPSSNGLMDLFAEFKCLDMGERLGRFISQYRVNYFVPDRMNGPIVYSYKLRNGAEEQIYEKISDIAEIIISAKYENVAQDIDLIGAMATGVSTMVRDSVVAYVEKDLELARKVMASDDKIDAYFDEIRDKMIAYIKAEHGEQGNRIFDLIMVTKYLERIGDHATNIAEWVEFSITGVHKDSAALHES